MNTSKQEMLVVVSHAAELTRGAGTDYRELAGKRDMDGE